MKKTGKVLSLVLSLALVASSLTATFASAAAENPVTGATVTLTGNTAIALSTETTGGTAVALPTPILTYTAANGKEYSNSNAAYTWTSSNKSVADLDSTGLKVIPGGTAGTATLTCTFSGQKLTGASATDTVTVSATKTISVTAYAADTLLVSDKAATGTTPDPTTELAVNGAPTYQLYQVGADSENKFAAAFTPVPAATWVSSNKNVIAIDSETGAVSAQDPTNVHIGSVRISATDPATNKQASLVIHTAKIYDGGTSSVAVTSSTSYGTGNATVGGYNVTGYAITGTTVTIEGGSVASVDVGSAGTANISGGAVTGAVTGGTVNVTGGTVGAIDSVGPVTVDSTAAAAKVGAISSDGAVTVSNATAGAIRAKGAITVNSGAVTGSLTGVATPTTVPSTSFTQTYPNVTIDSSTVKGNVVGNTVTVKSSQTDATTNKLIPTVVNGNILLMKSGTTAASAAVGLASPQDNDVTVTGSIADNDGGAAIALSGTPDGTTKVGGVVGKAPTSSSDLLTTTLTLTGVTGTFASLPNFASVNVDAGSEVTVNSALKIPALTIGGKATLAAGAVVDGQISGTGTLTFPAGSLVAKGGFAGGLTLNTTSAISTGTVIFKSISNQAGNVTIPGVTLEEKDNGDYTYNYVAKTVTFAGIKLDKSSLKVAKGYTDTLKASAVPAGSSLPTGDKIVWSVPSTDSYVQVTPSADGLTATVKAVDWSDVDLGGANEVTVTAYVADKDGNEVFDYPEQTCAVTAIEKPEGPLYTSDTTGTYNRVVGQSYTFKITASDGSLPPFVVASNGATVAPYTKSGNSYLYKVTGAKVGDYGVYVGDRVCILHITSGIKSDTTKVTIADGKTYQFKITKDAKSASAPQFVVAGQGVVLPVDVKGNDYFYKVTNNGRTGDVGVYVNGPKIAVITFTK